MCTNFCEQCGDCLECYAEDVCTDLLPHSLRRDLLDTSQYQMLKSFARQRALSMLICEDIKNDEGVINSVDGLE
jgi:hypothetical protein